MGQAADPLNAVTAQHMREIAATREHMGRTVGMIERRLDPAVLKEQVKTQLLEAKESIKADIREEIQTVKHSVEEKVRDAKWAVREATIGKVEHMIENAETKVSDAGHTLIETVKANPIPVALIGAGIAWMFINSRAVRGRPAVRRIEARTSEMLHDVQQTTGTAVEGASEAVRGFASEAKEKVGNAALDAKEAVTNAAFDAKEKVVHAAHDAKEKVTHVAHDARDRTVALARRARDTAVRAEHRVEQKMDETPLAIGAVLLAVGLGIGLSLPRTKRENELVGPMRDRLVERAKGLAHDAIEKAEEKVSQLGSQDEQQQPLPNLPNGISGGRNYERSSSTY